MNIDKYQVAEWEETYYSMKPSECNMPLINYIAQRAAKWALSHPVSMEPVAAQHRFRHPQKTMPDWSIWQICTPSDRPASTIDSVGYQVEYRALYTAAQLAAARQQGAEEAEKRRQDTFDDASEIIQKQMKRIAELESEIKNLHTVMMAAAVEITEHWDAHCDREGYGPANLVRRLENGYPEQYGYDAQTMVRQDKRIAELEKDNAKVNRMLEEQFVFIAGWEKKCKELEKSNAELLEALKRLTNYMRCTEAVFSQGRMYLDMTLIPSLTKEAEAAISAAEKGTP